MPSQVERQVAHLNAAVLQIWVFKDGPSEQWIPGQPKLQEVQAVQKDLPLVLRCPGPKPFSPVARSASPIKDMVSCKEFEGTEGSRAKDMGTAFLHVHCEVAWATCTPVHCRIMWRASRP